MTLGNTSVSCERGFSAMNNVKSMKKASMTMENCDKRLRLVLNGKKLHEFDFDAALREWTDWNIQTLTN